MKTDTQLVALLSIRIRCNQRGCTSQIKVRMKSYCMSHDSKETAAVTTENEPSFGGNRFHQGAKVVKFTVISGNNQLVFPAETHECVCKGIRQTHYIKCWYNTLWQSSVRFVRKILPFSKSDIMQEIVPRLLSFDTTHPLSFNHYQMFQDW